MFSIIPCQAQLKAYYIDASMCNSSHCIKIPCSMHRHYNKLIVTEVQQVIMDDCALLIVKN